MPQDLSAVAWPLRTDAADDPAGHARGRRGHWRIRRLPDGRPLDHPLRRPSAATYAEAFCDPERLSRTLVIERDGDGHRRPDARASRTPGRRPRSPSGARGVQAELGLGAATRRTAGSGYATEAVAELLRLCFEDLGLRRVLANCFADNEPSWRLMERLGMRRERVTRPRVAAPRAGWLDGLGYALLAEEWRERR